MKLTFFPASYILYQLSMQFPDEGLVYDYCLDDGGICKIGQDEDDSGDVLGEIEVWFA